MLGNRTFREQKYVVFLVLYVAHQMDKARPLHGPEIESQPLGGLSCPELSKDVNGLRWVVNIYRINALERHSAA